MNFDLKEEHILVNDAIERVLRDTCRPEHFRPSRGQSNDDRWIALNSLGIMGLLLPDEQGGLGQDELALITVGQTFGKYALPEPILEGVAVCAPLLLELAEKGSELASELFGQVLSGEKSYAIYDSEAGCNTVSPRSDGVLFRQRKVWKFVDGRPGPENILPSLDSTRSSFVFEDGCKSLLLGEPASEFATLTVQRGTLAASAELLGLGSKLLEMAVEYANMRTQFGKPIAGFQAIQHKLADVWTALRFAAPVLNRAAWLVSVGDKSAGLHVSHAKVACRTAADSSAKAAIQIFGAMGYTYESDLHFWLKRVWALQDHWGGRSHHEHIIAGELARLENLGPGASFPHRRVSAN